LAGRLCHGIDSRDIKAAILAKGEKAREQNRIGNAGLWGFTRNPNYFTLWMAWNALVIASTSSWLACV